jgi:hypothetical protein
MNNTLRKYELMKELNIPIGQYNINALSYDNRYKAWFFSTHNISDYEAAAIFERACREWLEKKGFEIQIYFVDGRVMGYEVIRQTPELENICCGGHCCENQSTACIAQDINSFDAAQIAALKECLKEKDIK